MRRRAVTLLNRAGMSPIEGSGLLGVRASTLRGWTRRWERGVLGPNPLGRPGYVHDRRTRDLIEDMALVVGPSVSVAYIKNRLAWIPRALVEDVVRSCKKDVRRKHRARMERLRWEKPGRVWSCDWTEPTMPIDGAYREILAVRDLASRKTLQSLPCGHRSAALATKAIEHLFLVNGPPLVMKSDGGGEFKADLFKGLLCRYRVTRLLSPEYYPQYNGAIEAGIGSLKAHAWYEAAKNGRVGYWTCDDLEAGRMKANETSRPLGPGGPSPDMLWEARSPITGRERRAFLKALDEERDLNTRRNDAPQTQRDKKADERHAIQSALERCGYLTVARRRVSLGEN